jgi:hypothetical protein
MITGQTMLEPMLTACPDFAPAWTAFQRDWPDADQTPHVLALAELARLLNTKLKHGETAEFPAVFEVVEHWLAEGDDYVQTAAAAGLIEGLQGASYYGSGGDILPWLGPLTLAQWRLLEGEPELRRPGSPVVAEPPAGPPIRAAIIARAPRMPRAPKVAETTGAPGAKRYDPQEARAQLDVLQARYAGPGWFWRVARDHPAETLAAVFLLAATLIVCAFSLTGGALPGGLYWAGAGAVLLVAGILLLAGSQWVRSRRKGR